MLILIPCLTAVGSLSLSIQSVDARWLLIVLVIRLFSSSMNQIPQAAVLGQVGRGTEGVTMGIVMGAKSVLNGVAPLIAAAVVNNYGIGSVFIYGAVLWVAGAVFLAFTPLRPQRERPEINGGRLKLHSCPSPSRLFLLVPARGNCSSSTAPYPVPTNFNIPAHDGNHEGIRYVFIIVGCPVSINSFAR